MDDLMQSGSGWKWYGFPGHFVGGRNCAFHLCTVVNGYLVSTLGAYRPDSSNKNETVGLGRYYETMVFTCPGDDENGDPIMGDEVEMQGYNESLEAERGHYRVCWKYSDSEQSDGG